MCFIFIKSYRIIEVIKDNDIYVGFFVGVYLDCEV